MLIIMQFLNMIVSLTQNQQNKIIRGVFVC